MSVTSSGRETPSRHTTVKSKPQHQAEIIDTSDSATETPKRSQDSSSLSAVSSADIHVQRQKDQNEYYQGTWFAEEDRGRVTPLSESASTPQLRGSQEKPSQSNMLDNKKSLFTRHTDTKPDTEDSSPPLTAKDSAYSSVSSASAMSPAYGSPRSASSMSSRQTAQFGLFPTRNLSTPKGSISSNLGSTKSPVDSSDSFPKPGDIPNRPHTSMSTYQEAPAKRLSKRSSFTSLKRLFSKKKSGDIGPIAE